VGAQFARHQFLAPKSGGSDLQYLYSLTHQVPAAKPETPDDVSRRKFAFIAFDLAMASSMLSLSTSVRSMPASLKLGLLAGSLAFNSDLIRRAIVPNWRQAMAITEYGIKSLLNLD
jgi:hypothetical protein